MELYFKDLISRESSLEKLVDDLILVVQGANDVAQAAGANLDGDHQEIEGRLRKLKEGCRKVRQHAIDAGLAVDKVVHRYPYASVGFAFGAGLLLGVLLKRASD